LRAEYDALCFLLVNKCLTMQLHPSEAIAIHYRVMSTRRYGEPPAGYWQNEIVRHIHFRSLSLRQWMHDNVKTLSVADLRNVATLVCPTLQFDSVVYSLYRNDNCPANSNYEGRPVTVDWACVWESPTLTMLYLASYFPPPSVNRPAGNIVQPLFRYDVDLKSDRLESLLYLLPDMRERYVEIVRILATGVHDNVYEYVDVDA